ncbi:hypothetical protein LTQ03_18455 [Vibrio splendidus]|uniref:hypothetical protein n=1 Tax=Vibrio splendidus TaxID=29497 RepID=UPI001FB2BEE8|nr:hypothetical protein [Vibrio splendidus]UOE82701.1 hypothetical protein LTQ03_18455 [Vibrio splendidus]
MKILTKSLRYELVKALKRGASYREQLDLSNFLQSGVTEQQIGMIDSALSLLKESPYLNHDDFVEYGYSDKQILNTLGDIEAFKSLIGIDTYRYADWLANNNLNPNDNFCLPYLVYQHFIGEIRESHMENSTYLNKNFRVHLGSEALSCLTFKCGSNFRIPVDESEMIPLILLSRAGKYTRVKISDDSTFLTLISDSQEVKLEIRVYASQLTTPEHIGICLIDDRHIVTGFHQVFKLSDFAIRHEANLNADLIEELNLFNMSLN